MPKAQLPCGQFPFLGESLLGYRLRLAELNHYPSPSWIFDGGIYKHIVHGASRHGKIDLIGHLSELTGHSAKDLAEVLLWSKSMPIRFINVHHPRVCPLCLVDGSYLRRIWDLSLITVCTLHQVHLVSSCPACGLALDWNRNRVAFCRCGYDLRAYVPPRPNENVIHLTRHLELAAQSYGIPVVIQQASLNFGESFPPLDLALIDLLIVVMYLGGVAVHGPSRVALMKPRMVHIDEASTLIKGAAEALRDWPQSFHASLAKLAALQTQASRQKIGTTFGHMYRYLFKDLCSSKFDFLREEFELFMKDNWPGVLASKKLCLFSQHTRQNGRYVSRHVASKTLGLTGEKIFSLVQSQILPGIIQKHCSGGNLVIVDRNGLDKFKDRYGKPLDLRQAAKLLGLNRQRIIGLVRIGLLDTVGNRNRKGPWQISDRSISKLLNGTMIALDDMQKPERYSKEITLGYLIKFYMTRDQSLFPLFMQAVAEQRLRPIGRIRGMRGLQGLVFDRTNALGFILGGDPTSKYLNARTCARHLAIKRTLANTLMRRGALPCKIIRRGSRRIRVVSLADVEAFHSKHVTASEVATKLGLHYHNVLLKLRLARINPLRTKKFRDLSTHMYLRAKVATVFPEALSLGELPRGS